MTEILIQVAANLLILAGAVGLLCISIMAFIDLASEAKTTLVISLLMFLLGIAIA